MKIKKIFSVIFAAVIAAAAAAVPACAVDDGKATYCFDTPEALSEWKTYGSVKEMGFEMKIDDAVSKNGNGSLLISLNSDGKVENKLGGAYVEASEFNIENFDGCVIEMSVLLCEGAENFYSELSLYSDGLIWLQNPVPDLSRKEWSTVVMTIPEGSKNTRVGFTMPTFEAYTGNVIYIDDFVITDKNGKIIKNRGDYAVKQVRIAALPKGAFLVGIILLVIFIGVIAGGVYLLVKSSKNKFV